MFKGKAGYLSLETISFHILAHLLGMDGVSLRFPFVHSKPRSVVFPVT